MANSWFETREVQLGREEPRMFILMHYFTGKENKQCAGVHQIERGTHKVNSVITGERHAISENKKKT